MTPSVVFIGAGNVASHLAPAIERSGSGNVIQVYSPTFSHAAELASRLKCAEVISDLAHIDRNANIYIVSIKDDGISPLVDSLAKTLQSRALWMHTSGSVPMDVFSPLTSRYGVYYPMQTFSKNAPLDMSEVPLFVEGNSEEVEYEIKEFAKKTFANVYHADSELRRKMHVAAVFSCNFTNYMWAIADELLSKEGLGFDVMKPLVEETMRKAFTVSPRYGQTGPAVRGDVNIMEYHKSMLPEREREIYDMLSCKIYEQFSASKNND